MILEMDGNKIIQWAEHKMNVRFNQPCIPLGWSVDGRVVAAFIFNGIYQNDVELSVVSEIGFTRTMLVTVAHMITDVIGSSRCSLTCRRDDEQTIKLVKKMGFVIEGCKRNYYRDGTDAVILGLTRADYERVLRGRYIRKGGTHGSAQLADAGVERKPELPVGVRNAA